MAEQINPQEFVDIARDKWDTYRRFGQFMPQTSLRPDTLLQRYGNVVVKPRYGEKGKDIRLVSQRGDIPWEDFIIQQPIDMLGFEDRVFDVRFYVHKDITTFYSRISEKHSMVTNISRGGRVEDTYKLFDALGIDHDILLDMQDVVDEIIASLPPFTEAGFDFVIDKQNKIYFLEINSQPGISGLHILADPDDSKYEGFTITYTKEDKQKFSTLLQDIETLRGEKLCAASLA